MDTVSRSDRWNASLYDRKHAFISQYGEGLFELLAPKKGEYILDLGCGTGDIAKKLNDLGANVKGIDSSDNMIQQARNKYPDIEFDVEDATTLDYKDQFDAVFSNATLHWVKPPVRALSCIYGSLKSQGRFVAEFGGKGNVQLITTEIKKQALALNFPYHEERFPWFFPSIGEYATLMEEVGFTVTFATLFERPTPLIGNDGLRNWIEMFGKMMFEELGDERLNQLITNVEKGLKEIIFKEDTWIADYKRIRIIGVKE